MDISETDSSKQQFVTDSFQVAKKSSNCKLKFFRKRSFLKIFSQYNCGLYVLPVYSIDLAHSISLLLPTVQATYKVGHGKLMIEF